MMNFIKTKDPETAENLRVAGFKCISDECGFWTFLNDEKLVFADQDKVHYSNILTFE